MKVLCINITNNKNEKIKIGNLNIKKDCNDFVEISIPLNILNKRVFENKRNFTDKIKGYFLDRKILSLIKNKDKDKIYILPKTLDKVADKDSAINSIKIYLETIASKAGYNYFTYLGNIKANIYKYINEKLLKLQKQPEQIKTLFIYSNYSNIDYDLIKESIEKFKSVDIYCKDYYEKKKNIKLEEINENYGTSISIRNKMLKKDYKIGNYDIVIYMDKGSRTMTSYSSCRIDLYDDDNDKFDKYSVYINENKIYKELNSDYLSYMIKNYGKLKVYSLLCKKHMDT